MILVKKSLFYLTLILTCSLLILLGVIFYVAMNRGDIFGVLQIKYHAENAVFVSVVCVLCVIILYLIMGRKSVHVLRELDKISQLSRQGRYYSGEYTKRLGKLGERIDHLFVELNRLNEAKSLKIGVISEVNRFLLKHCELRLCITDVQGVVQYCSDRFANGFGVEKEEILGKNIVDFVDDLRFEELMREIERKREGLSAGKVHFRVKEAALEAVLELFPVQNNRGELELILCTAEKESVLSEVAQKAEQVQAHVSRAGKRFTEVLRRKKKRSS